MAYIGTSPQNGVRNRFVYAATQGQTAFTGADADSKTLVVSDQLYTDVYQNGVKLKLTTDWTASSTTVTLVNAASVSDVIEILSFDVFSVSDTVPASTGGTFAGAISATSYGAVSGTTGTFSGAVSGSTISGSVTSGTTATLSSSQATSNIDILKLEATGTSSSSNLKFNVASGAQGQIRLGGNNDISIHNTSSDTERLRILSGGGLTFNGDTAAANALDDYEEGSGALAVTGTGGGTAATSGTPDYQYTKVGNLVSFQFEFQCTSVSGVSGALQIALPFTATDYGAGSIRCYSVTFDGSPFLGISNNTSQVYFKANKSGNATQNILSTGYYYGQITYKT